MSKLLLIDKNSLYPEVVECNDLRDYYKYLDCTCFDITRRKVGDKWFDIFCDDEGLLKDNYIATAYTSDHEPALVGNLIFANHNEQGETTSLSDDDIMLIRDNMLLAMTVVKSKDDYETKLHAVCILNMKS